MIDLAAILILACLGSLAAAVAVGMFFDAGLNGDGSDEETIFGE